MKPSNVQKMTRDEVVEAYDQTMGNTVPGGFWADELARRDAADRDDRLIALTNQIKWLTLVVTGATILALAVTVFSLLRGIR